LIAYAFCALRLTKLACCVPSTRPTAHMPHTKTVSQHRLLRTSCWSHASAVPFGIGLSCWPQPLHTLQCRILR
jgi:hypothetical protein